MKYIISILICLVLSGCAGTSQTGLITVDGKLDETEAALIGLTVDAALAAKPSAVAPAYAVSAALLASKDVVLGQSVLVSYLDTVIKAEVDKLGLTPAGIADFNRLVVIVKSKIKLDLEVQGISEKDKLVFVFDVVKVVNDVAKSRMK